MRRMIPNLAAYAVAVLVVGLHTPIANAVPVRFESPVFLVHDRLGDLYAAGDPAIIKFDYDPFAPGSDVGDPLFPGFNYPGAISDFTLTINDLVWSSPGADVRTYTVADANLVFFVRMTLTGPGANGYEPTHADLTLFNMDGQPNTDHRLPTNLDVSPQAAPTTSYYLNWNQFWSNELGHSATNRIRGTWTGGIQVPEPSTLPLFAIALGFLGIAARRRNYPA